MQFDLGIKSDPIEYRYTFEWLFDLLAEIDVRYVQLGSFCELYSLEDGFFEELREQARQRNIVIKSCFTTHRELGGFFSGNSYLRHAAMKNYKRYIEAASILGADYIGSNPGTVPRDRMELKQAGIESYLSGMKELMQYACGKGLKGLTIEPMSSSAEPPSFPEEMDYMLGNLREYHRQHPGTTVPVFLCGDISHGVADEKKAILHDNVSLFRHGIPYMAEFHFKNTDALFSSTFGFSLEERRRGIVEIGRIMQTVRENDGSWPVDHVIGYFETGGPKMGRDYSDILLRRELIESLEYLKEEIYTAVSD